MKSSQTGREGKKGCKAISVNPLSTHNDRMLCLDRLNTLIHVKQPTHSSFRDIEQREEHLKSFLFDEYDELKRQPSILHGEKHPVLLKLTAI